MSNWTHVAAIVRVDSLRFVEGDIDFERVFGKQISFHSDASEWDEAMKHPERFLPMGSEGSLKMQIWANPDMHSMAAYTIAIFGDLRDHDSAQAIVDWFKDKCSELFIRQATIIAENERNGVASWDT